MGKGIKKYWSGIEELDSQRSTKKVQGKNNFDSQNINSLRPNRREFLQYAGYGISIVAFISACKKNPLKRLRPFLPMKDQLNPARKKWFASTCYACTAACPILVKITNNRAIKIEGNINSPLTEGGVCAFGHASFLNLYNDNRLNYPLINNVKTSWKAIDEQISSEIKSLTNKKGRIVLLSSTIISPSTKKLIQEFGSKFPNFEHISFDPVSSYGMLKANERCFGKKIIPNYKFDKARIIISFGADFLSTWNSPIEFTRKYLKTRDVDRFKNMSYHLQFESILSLTGSNADERISIKPSEEGLILISLYNKIAELSGNQRLLNHENKYLNRFEDLAVRLWKEKGRSLIISNSNNTSIQMIINGLNALLGNYGRTIDLDNPSFQKQGDDKFMINLVEKMNNGLVDGLIIYGSNPIYNYFEAAKFQKALKKVLLTISFSNQLDKTTEHIKYICPDNHFLESWNDYLPKQGFYSLSQPVINSKSNTRSAQDSLLKWMGSPSSYYDYLRSYWKDNLFSKQKEFIDFDIFWDESVKKGIFLLPLKRVKKYNFNLNLESAAHHILQGRNNHKGLELVLYETANAKNGNLADNPILNELPDPISKVSWGNYASISLNLAQKANLNDEDLIEIKNHNNSIQLPVIIQPGQANDTIGISLGYGNNSGIGVNVYPFIANNSDSFSYDVNSIEIIGTGKKNHLARTQSHHNINGTNIIRDLTLGEYLSTPISKKSDPLSNSFSTVKRSFYPHHWAIVIDLNNCTGCSACVISCQIENNIPVVGQDQVKKKREMHWLRIDRYYTGNINNPKVYFQPIMCQQCDNAPCEAVCPVSATSSSSEGLNQQTYQRCIGTRFCASNCPYHVRRFNYYQYTDNEENNYHLSKDTFNPDVTIRERGVIEKCSFCIQRIQEAKIKVKNDNKPLQDGEIKTACEQSCPGKAIIFGDLNDKSCRVSRLINNKRCFRILNELNTNPSIYFLAKVRNNKD